MLTLAIAASKIPDKSLNEVRNTLTGKTIDILTSYRKNFSLSHPPAQLVLPELMKEFSMYILSLLKSRALKGKSCVVSSSFDAVNWL